MKQKLIAKLLWRYEGLVREIVAQKNNFPTEADYFKTWLKYAQVVNYLHGAKFRSL